MLLPFFGAPQTIAQAMEKYRELFFRSEGFEHVSRYLTGLILSPNKTLQGIYDAQVWDRDKPSRRAMHEAVFESPWDSRQVMEKHRQVVSADHQDKGKEVITLDWTLSHHDKGPNIFGVDKAYDYIKRRTSLFQTVVTAAISNREFIDGLAVEVQQPSNREEELAYLEATGKDAYTQMEQVYKRLLELMHFHKNELGYKKRTEIALEIVREIEAEGHFPNADYAFDNGVLWLGLTQFIESSGKHWVSELESSRNINWQGEWKRVDVIAQEIREHPKSFRPYKVRCRNGEIKDFWAFTKVVRLKRYGRKRLVIVHEKEDLTDTPRFLVTDALHWESSRVIETWSYRWAVEVFHEFGKQVTGLESAQVRKEEAVKRHFRLSCIAQSVIQRAPAVASKSERFEFANGEITFGQKCRAIARESFHNLLNLIKRLFIQGHSSDHVLEVLMPT